MLFLRFVQNRLQMLLYDAIKESAYDKSYSAPQCPYRFKLNCAVEWDGAIILTLIQY